jgi:hypothetical protein
MAGLGYCAEVRFLYPTALARHPRFHLFNSPRSELHENAHRLTVMLFCFAECRCLLHTAAQTNKSKITQKGGRHEPNQRQTTRQQAGR